MFRPRNQRVALLTTILGGAGIMHFLRPKFFDAIVPSWMPGSARTTTLVSGAVELAAAAAVAMPSTRRKGGLFALATFIAVYPANIWAALQGGMKGLDAPFDSAAAAWIRLPFQFPMFWLAMKVANESTDPVG
jgi:uncharacterized membrane protein